MLTNKRVLITGGTGSFGKMFTKLIFQRFPGIKRLVILSRDEQKHYQLAMEYPEHKYEAIRYFIGDVREESRLISAFEGIDIVIHAAAMKHVHLAEYNPMECVKTNILGAENVINAAGFAAVDLKLRARGPRGRTVPATGRRTHATHGHSGRGVIQWPSDYSMATKLAVTSSTVLAPNQRMVDQLRKRY